MIPPNAGPPKTIVIVYPGAEEKVRKQYVYQTYLTPQEHDRIALVPGNERDPVVFLRCEVGLIDVLFANFLLCTRIHDHDRLGWTRVRWDHGRVPGRIPEQG